MVQLAKDGISAYQHWRDYLETEISRATFHNDGVLWLATGGNAQAKADAERLRAFGLRMEVLNDDDVRSLYPALNPCLVPPDLISGKQHRCRGGGEHLLEVDGGHVDPMDALFDIAEACHARRVEIRLKSKLTAISVRGGAIRSVSLEDGSAIDCSTVVNAAGPWCNRVFELAGIEISWPLRPTRIQVIHLDRPPEVIGNIPVCVDAAGGIYFRTQNRGQQIIVSSVLEEDEKEDIGDPDDYARYVDDHFVPVKLHALQHRLPNLHIRGVQGYSGLYTINRADVHPIVGPTAISGLYAANGCSGHGFKIAPAIGSLLAQMICGSYDSFETSVDHRFLAPDRTPIAVGSLSVIA